MRTLWWVSVLAWLLHWPVRADDLTTNSVSKIEAENVTDHWAFVASIYGYLAPESRDYVNPNFTADHGWAHLEARYNYEALETGSVLVGYNFSAGEKIHFEITPTLGGVFGDLTGIAPGYTLSLSYWHLNLWSQSEYFVDTGNTENSFFYTWSELTYSPWDWLRAGVVTQRTKAYKSDLDIQRGFLVGVSYRRVELTTYVFNLGWTDPTVVLAAAYNF
jgi:hypothetical protein